MNCFRRIILIVIALGSLIGVHANETSPLKVAVKLNSLACLGIVNPAIEVQLNTKTTLQMEGLGIFYLRTGLLGSNAVREQIVMASTWLEARFYKNKAFSGFYLGPNIGWSSFRFNKGIFPFYEKRPDSFQVGFNLMAGLTLGYVWEIKPQWRIDFSWGGGYQGATYEAYLEPSGERVVPINGSAEWMPVYKGGASLVYLF